MNFARLHGMLHMMFKLGQCAEKKWRKLRGFDYLAKVVTGVKFKDGIEVTADDQVAVLFNLTITQNCIKDPEKVSATGKAGLSLGFSTTSLAL